MNPITTVFMTISFSLNSKIKNIACVTTWLNKWLFFLFGVLKRIVWYGIYNRPKKVKVIAKAQRSRGEKCKYTKHTITNILTVLLPGYHTVHEVV